MYDHNLHIYTVILISLSVLRKKSFATDPSFCRIGTHTLCGWMAMICEKEFEKEELKKERDEY